jgi:hypothetical protein
VRGFGGTGVPASAGVCATAAASALLRGARGRGGGLLAVSVDSVERLRLRGLAGDAGVAASLSGSSVLLLMGRV